MFVSALLLRHQKDSGGERHSNIMLCLYLCRYKLRFTGGLMGLAAACQVYLFSIISTPKDSEVSNGKHPVSCVTVIAADYLGLFVLR